MKNKGDRTKMTHNVDMIFGKKFFTNSINFLVFMSSFIAFNLSLSYAPLI